MRSLITSSMLLAVAIAGCHMSSKRVGSGDGTVVAKNTPPTRTFHVRYEAEGKELPVGGPLRLWIPVPSDDPWQTIKNLHVDSASMRHSIETESVHRNKMVYIEGPVPAEAIKVVISYDVERWERKTDPVTFNADGIQAEPSVDIYQRPSKLAVINEQVQNSAAALAQEKTSTWAKARAFYDFIDLNMKYGKPEGKPWGRGDTEYACSEGVGNCTDFHSYFTSLCHAVSIPARFQIGLYGDYRLKPGEEYKAGNYHCWAEFHVPGRGWVPVDISEADKDPTMKEYFFGAHTDNRVTLSTGRDLVLAPRQSGAPLNFFVNPYAEIDGTESKSFSKTAYWTDAK